MNQEIPVNMTGQQKSKHIQATDNGGADAGGGVEMGRKMEKGCRANYINQSRKWMLRVRECMKWKRHL